MKKKKQVMMIHGGSAYSDYVDFKKNLETCEVHNPLTEKPKRWSQGLRESLGEEYEVCAPEMPNKNNAQYDEWKIWFERHFEFLTDDVVLIGWSLGAMFLVKYLSETKLPMSIRHIYLVATPVTYFKDERTGDDAGDFNFSLEQLESLKSFADKITLFHSKDDFVVPYAHAEAFMKTLPEAELVTFADRNHFLQEEFPEIVAHIKGLD